MPESCVTQESAATSRKRPRCEDGALSGTPAEDDFGHASPPTLSPAPADLETSTDSAGSGSVDVDSANCYDSETQVYQISSTTSTLMQDIQNLPTVTSLQIQQGDPNLEQDKKSIYGHPLYPLLSGLLEKCEGATAQPDSPPPDTFEVELRSFVQRQEADGRPFFTDDSELDALMVKAIQVLRIHLLELRKVNELCSDFCSRYINCLKSKIQTDALLQDSAPSSPTGSDCMSPPLGMMQGNGYHGYGPMMSPVHSGMAPGMHHPGMGHMGMGCYGNGGDGSGGSLSPGYQTNDPMMHHHGHHHHLSGDMMGQDPSKQKRGVLPKKATQIMKQWLFQHLVHPYPTEDEKRQIAGQTNLTLLQVNNWFINARRRILQPMLDASNPIGGFGGNSGGSGEGSGKNGGSGLGAPSNKKKKAATNRPTNNRFWPASLAAAANLPSANTASVSANSGSATTTTTPSSASPVKKCSSPMDDSVSKAVGDGTARSKSSTPTSAAQQTSPSRSRTTTSTESAPFKATPTTQVRVSSAMRSPGLPAHSVSSARVVTTLAESTTQGNSGYPGPSMDSMLMLGLQQASIASSSLQSQCSPSMSGALDSSGLYDSRLMTSGHHQHQHYSPPPQLLPYHTQHAHHPFQTGIHGDMVMHHPAPPAYHAPHPLLHSHHHTGLEMSGHQHSSAHHRLLLASQGHEECKPAGHY